MTDEASCDSCRFCDMTTETGTGEPLTICRRYPPAVTADDEGPMQVWPSVTAADWCGEWRARG